MLQVLSSVFVFAAVAFAVVKYASSAYVLYLEATRSAARLVPARRVLRAVLLRAAVRAVKLAARLERAEVLAEKEVVRLALRRYAPERRVGVGLVETVVWFAVAAYFVAGLVGVFAG
ncbi:MAG TPA: hypothetical protein VMG60_01965 [Burkholderiaceae bacterium]|nr:hypothetical protein [Burkholderiaceae bacterium]